MSDRNELLFLCMINDRQLDPFLSLPMMGLDHQSLARPCCAAKTQARYSMNVQFSGKHFLRCATNTPMKWLER